MKSELDRANGSKPDVGVVMPVYIQDHDYLRTALRTILTQSYHNYAFMIVVDGAPLDIVEVISEVTKGDTRVEIVVKSDNEGVSKALNTGFERLMKIDSIEYLTWVSSDNLYHPSFLEKLRDALNHGPAETGLAYSSFRTIDAAGNLLPIDLAAFRRYQDQPKANLIEAGFVGVSFMYKKKYAALIAGYGMEPVEDFDYWLRLTEFCDIRYVPEELMDYRENAPLSISRRIYSSKYQRRRWRYAFNLSRQEARTRRGISVETTIVFPLQRGTEKTIEDLESLLDQYWSNYTLWIVDLGLDSSFVFQLRQIEDPRISYLAAKGDEMAAIRQLMPHVQSPYTLLHREGRFPRTLDALARLQALLSAGAGRDDSKVIAAYYAGDGRSTAVRERKPWRGPAFGELYRTEKLREILSTRRLDFFAQLARAFRRERSDDRA